MLLLEECKEKLTHFKQMSGKKFGIIRIGIFGSVARQENTPESDIDIVVEIEKPSLHHVRTERDAETTLRM